MKTREKTIIGKIPFENVSFQEAVNTTLLTTNENEQASAIRLSNSYCVSLAEQDEKYASLFQDEGYNFADGKPITWAMRLLTQKSASQIRGADFFRAVVDAGRSRDIKHAFIGGNQDVLEKLERTLTNAYPGIKIVSLWDPGYVNPDEGFYDQAISQFRDLQTDIIWLGLGTPKQDFISAELVKRIGVTSIGIGAAFDFVAGTKKQAPLWVQKIGFEWFHRLLSEPKRLGMRYLRGNIIFLGTVSKQLFQKVITPIS